MSLFNKNKLKPNWIFFQKGILWKFFFAGENVIVGETRDIENRIVYLFSIDVNTGKKYLNDFLFEDGGFWNASTNACNKNLYITRLDKSGLPFSKGIIALDVFTGCINWEINDVDYFFHNGENIYLTKQNFENTDIYIYGKNEGNLIQKVETDKYKDIYNLRDKSDNDYFEENFNYPQKLNQNNLSKESFEIISEEMGNLKSDSLTEFIETNKYIIFNYYIKTNDDSNNGNKFYENVFCIYERNKKELVYKTVLNKRTNYEVPDNFFVKNNLLYFIKEKKELIAIKL